MRQLIATIAHKNVNNAQNFDLNTIDISRCLIFNN